MLRQTLKYLKYPRVTQKYPHEPMRFPGSIGRPVLDAERCNGCGLCETECPVGAVARHPETGARGFNLDQCIFCCRCEDVCPQQAIRMSDDFEMAAFSREELRCDGTAFPDHLEAVGKTLHDAVMKRLGRSLAIREVDAGSCNGCDYEANALNNPFNDLERFGIHFVASPRHADMLLVTGIGSRNMQEALVKTYEAAPEPRLVVAVGACACSGGIFRGTYASNDGIGSLVPVDVWVPGCPPRPHAILYGILKAVHRLPEGR